MGIPLTKTMDPEDYKDLAPEVEHVKEYFESASPQASQRVWEYSLALRAYNTWEHNEPGLLVDIGGAGSPFGHTLSRWAHAGVELVDPAAGTPDLHAKAEEGDVWNGVFCISVIEHVPDLQAFVEDLARVVAPGGLLFLTMDAQDGEDPDAKHFRWMRNRIFTPKSWQALAQAFMDRGFSLLGTADWTYHGDQVYDYSFASLALTKAQK